jgi:NAD(P)-dependent dehydrogenase (short-subunit alcohol dehydrogenase family)
MNREMTAATTTVVLDGDSDAGYQLARRLLAQGRRVAVVARHPAGAVRVMHGQSADRVLVIGGDPSDERQWNRIVERVAERLGRIDRVVRAEAVPLRASA